MKNVIKKIANLLYVWLEGLEFNLKVLCGSKIREEMAILDPTSDINQKQKEYKIKKISLIITVFLIGGFFSLLLWINSLKSGTIEDNKIYRNEYGDGDKDITLYANDGEEEIEVTINLRERIYTIDEQKEMFEDFKKDLEEKILGKNESLNKIEYNLNLIENIDEYPFTIEWETDNTYIDYTGELIYDKLDKPVLTELCADISGDGFEQILRIPCEVYSRNEPHPTKKLLEDNLRKLQDEGINEEYIELPKSIGQKELTWRSDNNKKLIICLLLTPVIAVIICLCSDRDIQKQVEEREEQMIEDYPEIISKLSLYIGAGMTVNNAWTQIAIDYLKRKEKDGTRRYSYEQMLITMREINSGSTIQEAYDRFGKRCQISCYTRITTLLSQNIRKGSNDLVVLLNEESKEAFEERKHCARRQGEKASTKLLVPMMMILLIVMVVIVVPAFINQF